MRGGKSVQFGRTLLMVGGNDQVSIFEFDPANDGWIVREEELEEPRSNHGVAMVDDQTLLCL